MGVGNLRLRCATFLLFFYLSLVVLICRVQWQFNKLVNLESARVRVYAWLQTLLHWSHFFSGYLDTGAVYANAHQPGKGSQAST
jgi:hypothetical protein